MSASTGYNIISCVNTIAYTYTPRGPLATITDSRGAVTAFQYDLKDRLTAKVVSVRAAPPVR